MGDQEVRLSRHHHSEHLVDREEVDAATPTLEIVAGAAPLSGQQGDLVSVVVAPECQRKLVDRNPIELVSVAICLLDLADKRTVHVPGPPSPLTWALSRPPSDPARSTGDGGRWNDDTPARP